MNDKWKAIEQEKRFVVCCLCCVILVIPTDLYIFFFFFFFTRTGAGLKMIVKYSSTDGSSAIYRSRKGKDRSVHRELIFISVRATTVKRSRVNQRQLSQSKLGRIVATHLPLWCILLNFFYNLKQLFRCNSIFKPVACHNIVSDSLV